ncbi:MAG: 50S ribosomal protein L31 [Candidatus Buchananbacteria bacterium RIFCSPLOWO2_01_FULL_56_15]|uniref:Large ribosomal subunit protein bL31 n=2 Tax=Candidatus Buchananiibacteriota TaxID=1817903 RepID=A0A1G1YR43_9BACT|nr:MAG: 50S ribosomal protein L31 [Candidatus Buchananbacteria bacterium RIFCSPLOWO2_01_FULL_56_15]
MKKDIHPKYHQAKVTCACGNSFVVGSTLPEIHVEICSVCHPFYTGKQKLLDTARRVEKFQARAAQQKQIAKSRRGKKVKKAKAAARKKETKPVKETKEQ